MKKITAYELIEEFDLILLDAYGVLVNRDDALPGAHAFLQMLKEKKREYLIVTNDASRLPAHCAYRYQQRGLEIPTERIITSGLTVLHYFQQMNLAGARTVVLGPAGAHQYAQEAGATLITDLSSPQERVDVVIVSDECGYDLLTTIDQLLSLLINNFDHGHSVRLLVPNPDLIYPKEFGSFGITAGAVALLLEEALKVRFGHDHFRFERLGKPFLPIFEIALTTAAAIQPLPPRQKIVMVGDQLRTDIQGAKAAALTSCLIMTGVTSWGALKNAPADEQPDLILENLVGPKAP